MNKKSLILVSGEEGRHPPRPFTLGTLNIYQALVGGIAASLEPRDQWTRARSDHVTDVGGQFAAAILKAGLAESETGCCTTDSNSENTRNAWA